MDLISFFPRTTPKFIFIPLKYVTRVKISALMVHTPKVQHTIESKKDDSMVILFLKSVVSPPNTCQPLKNVYRIFSAAFFCFSWFITS